MIYKNKSEIARNLECWRQKIYNMIDRWEIKPVYIKDKRIGYVIVLDFIKYLLD